MKPLLVVAGIVEKNGEILISQRKANGQRALKWEFPGGKVEKGETPEEALERELMEELDIRTKTGRIFDAKLHGYPEGEVLVLFYRSSLVSGLPRAIDVNGFRFVKPEELLRYDFAPADVEVAERPKMLCGNAPARAEKDEKTDKSARNMYD
ncbi:MAG: (deoxy)nucleoside triphosphate pyrophosphohydrolase [Clostridia bacterium]|nr:(deoxy)nucleoside triphosphate pyrophosphohydrolase [Clostridia bacterium]